MADRSSKRKRPADLNRLAASIVEAATEGEPDGELTMANQKESDVESIGAIEEWIENVSSENEATSSVDKDRATDVAKESLKVFRAEYQQNITRRGKG